VSFVYESADAALSIGYLFYDELIRAGYVNTNGTASDSSDDRLTDSNGNGVADFHEDLYNLAPPSGPHQRPYLGVTRRCSSTFVSGGLTFSTPELATDSSCDAGFQAQVSIPDPTTPATWSTARLKADVVGTRGDGSLVSYSDRGLFRVIPNLLEPRAPANGNFGLGHILFVHAEDDVDTTVFRNMSDLVDSSAVCDGVPDYDVSAYDADGRVRATNPDLGISNADRTVDLGIISAGRELVFFVVSSFQAIHGEETLNRVFLCARTAPTNPQLCTLYLASPVSVFFSKSFLNLDQNPVAEAPAAVRNVGCAYPGHAVVTGPAGSPYVGTSQRCWLDAATLKRLKRPEYRNRELPLHVNVVQRPPSGRTPHVMMASPASDSAYVVVGFEDLAGGGDRDFNDVVIVLTVQTPPQRGDVQQTVTPSLGKH
jgi:hypothetical protein